MVASAWTELAMHAVACGCSGCWTALSVGTPQYTCRRAREEVVDLPVVALARGVRLLDRQCRSKAFAGGRVG